MKNFILKIALLSTICASAACAMETEFPDFEVRNESNFPVKVTVNYKISGLEEDIPSSLDPINLELDPLDSKGSPIKKALANPQRYGHVTVTVDGGITCCQLMDLISCVTVVSKTLTLHRFKEYTPKNTTQEELTNT